MILSTDLPSEAILYTWPHPAGFLLAAFAYTVFLRHTDQQHVSVLSSCRWFRAVDAFLSWWTFGSAYCLIGTQMLSSSACGAFYRWFLLESCSDVWLVYVEVLRNLLPKWPSCFVLPQRVPASLHGSHCGLCQCLLFWWAMPGLLLSEEVPVGE